METREQIVERSIKRFRGMSETAIRAERATWKDRAPEAVAADIVLKEIDDRKAKKGWTLDRRLVVLGIIVAIISAYLALK